VRRFALPRVGMTKSPRPLSASNKAFSEGFAIFYILFQVSIGTSTAASTPRLVTS
jgi:hypothetical protein